MRRPEQRMSNLSILRLTDQRFEPLGWHARRSSGKLQQLDEIILRKLGDDSPESLDYRTVRLISDVPRVGAPVSHIDHRRTTYQQLKLLLSEDANSSELFSVEIVSLLTESRLRE